VGELTMGELLGLFNDTKLFETFERVFKRDLSQLKKAEHWRELRNRAAHPGHRPVNRQEADAFLAAIDLYLHQVGLAEEERPMRGSIRPWHQVAVPHRDIREGKFDESVFAADL